MFICVLCNDSISFLKLNNVSLCLSKSYLLLSHSYLWSLHINSRFCCSILFEIISFCWSLHFFSSCASLYICVLLLFSLIYLNFSFSLFIPSSLALNTSILPNNSDFSPFREAISSLSFLNNLILYFFWGLPVFIL